MTIEELTEDQCKNIIELALPNSDIVIISTIVKYKESLIISFIGIINKKITSLKLIIKEDLSLYMYTEKDTELSVGNQYHISKYFETINLKVNLEF